MDRIKALVVGGSGVTGVEVVNSIDFSAISTDKDTLSLILQLLIAVVSLAKIIKGEKKTTLK